MKGAGLSVDKFSLFGKDIFGEPRQQKGGK
jgi:hypothetical protein